MLKNKFKRYTIINGAIGALIFYYFVRKVQIYYEVDVSIDYLAGAAWYGLGLGFIFGLRFIRIEELISFLKRK